MRAFFRPLALRPDVFVGLLFSLLIFSLTGRQTRLFVMQYTTRRQQTPPVSEKKMLSFATILPVLAQIRIIL
jgi:hypothetical protein